MSDYYIYKGEKKYFVRTHNSNVKTFYKMLMITIKNAKNSYDKMKEINCVEYNYYENCYNGATMKLIKTGEHNVIGYDFKNSYLSLMASKVKIEGVTQQFLFPMKEGTEQFIKKISMKNIQYGIYNVKITCDNEDFNKIFTFNYYNYYTHYDLFFCFENKEKYGIKIKMVKDCEYNCLIYDKDDLIDGSIFFSNLYHRLTELKQKYPKNKLNNG